MNGTLSCISCVSDPLRRFGGTISDLFVLGVKRECAINATPVKLDQIAKIADIDFAQVLIVQPALALLSVASLSAHARAPQVRL